MFEHCIYITSLFLPSPPGSGFFPSPSKIHGLIFFNYYCYEHTDRHRQKDIYTHNISGPFSITHMHICPGLTTRDWTTCVYSVFYYQKNREKSQLNTNPTRYLKFKPSSCKCQVLSCWHWTMKEMQCFTTWLHRKNAVPFNVVEICPARLSNSVLMGSKVSMKRETR